MLKQKPRDEASGNDYTATFDTVSTHVSTCPDCDGEVVDGQGLLDCTDCRWTGLVN